MKKLNKQAIIRQAERALKRTEEYKSNRGIDSLDYKMSYIVMKENTSDLTTVKAFAVSEDYLMGFSPYKDEQINTYLTEMISADFIVSPLEDDNKLIYMSLDTHHYIWNEISEYGLEYIESPDAFQKYLKYCKQHGITKAKLQEKVDYNGEDIMKFYQKEKRHSEPER